MSAELLREVRRLSTKATRLMAIGDALLLRAATMRREAQDRDLLPAGRRSQAPPNGVKGILALVAQEYGVSEEAILSDLRTQAVAWPRMVTMALARRTTLYSLPRIGRAVGGRDHTTVLHAVRRVEARAEAEPDFAALLDRLVIQINQPRSEA